MPALARLEPLDPRLPYRQRPQLATLVAIAAAHALAGWLLSRVPTLRDAADHLAPLVVTIVSAERPVPAPAEPLPLPPAPHVPPPPMPLAVPIIEWTAAPPIVAPARPVAPATEMPSALLPAAPAPTTLTPLPAPAERQIAITQVEYLSPPVLLYPLAARRQREQGLVQVRVRVDEQGRPERFAVVRSSSHAALDEAALQTVRATRFKPYTENGVAMPFWVVMPLLFDLDNP